MDGWGPPQTKVDETFEPKLIRIVQSDGTTIFQSNAPHDQSFNPAEISPPLRQPGTRKERLSNGVDFQARRAGSVC